MKKPESLGYYLARGICHGWWTLEQLDQPSPTYQELEHERQRSRQPCDPYNDGQRVLSHGNYWTFTRPVMEYPPAVPYRNLAREWIEANPKAWQKLQEEMATKRYFP